MNVDFIFVFLIWVFLRIFLYDFLIFGSSFKVEWGNSLLVSVVVLFKRLSCLIMVCVVCFYVRRISLLVVKVDNMFY